MNKLLTCLLVCASLQAYATDEEITLSKVSYFSLGNQGFAGKKSEGEVYYERIFHSAKRNREIFREILESNKATNEAKLYAACGLLTGNG